MSFAALHPWAPRPDRRLVGLAPEGFWRAHSALPLRLDADGLLVATSGPLDAAAARALRAFGGQPVHQVRGAHDEILFWLDVVEGRRGWAEALATGLASLARQLGLTIPEPVGERPPDTAQEALSVEGAAASLGLTHQTALELLALRARLPWVRLANYHPAGRRR